MKLNYNEITSIIKKRINKFSLFNEIYNEGTIISINDGIIHICGLSEIMQNEMIKLPGDNFYAIALNLEKFCIGAVVMGSYENLKEGMKVKSTGRILSVPVGNNLLGRVLNTLGIPIDGKGSLKYSYLKEVESIAPNVIEREPVNNPLQTGYKSIDVMTPIGQGQRELIIGDRQTGKSTLAIDTIINQNNKNIKCIYVAIGQKNSTIVNVVEILKKKNAFSNTIVLVASASEPAILQYLIPYSGCTMGEYFRNLGENALIVYDDLSKQAIAYRQISLLLRRPPGREAYPGDIFYIHSRLLERASRVNKKYIELFTNGVIKNKTGSLTAIPIIETQSGDTSAFISTNVISITDGQIFLESNLFNSNIRPAINPGISVSRVGGAAQTNIVKKLSSDIRTTLAQYNELSAFSQFSSDLDDNTRDQLDHGQKIIELFKQKQYSGLSVSELSIILFAIKNKFFKNVKLENISYLEKKLIYFVNNKYINLMNEINIYGLYNKEIKLKFLEILNNFKNLYNEKFFKIY